MKNTENVIRMQREHRSGAALLERLCFSEPWSETALELLLRDGEAVGFVCERDGAVLAYGGMLIAPFEGQILNIAVHPDARRQGLGEAVLSALVQEAQARTLEAVVLEVRVSNTGAIALYEKAGFARLGTRKSFYRNPVEDALVMGVDLSV